MRFSEAACAQSSSMFAFSIFRESISDAPEVSSYIASCCLRGIKFDFRVEAWSSINL